MEAVIDGVIVLTGVILFAVAIPGVILRDTLIIRRIDRELRTEPPR